MSEPVELMKLLGLVSLLHALVRTLSFHSEYGIANHIDFPWLYT
jgi:hypothetical protein